MEKSPERLVHLAVKGMLPKGKLGKRQRLKLKVYAGSEHPHGAQQPKVLAIKPGKRKKSTDK